jgi:hypothetical protein
VKPAADLVDDSCIVAVRALYYVEPILYMLCTSNKYCICFIWPFFLMVSWGFVSASCYCDIFIHTAILAFSHP